MKDYATADIRNVALVAHGGTGKTSLTEAMAFRAGLVSRLGRVDDGSTISDFDPDEIKRKINLIDTPGYADFVGEEKTGLRAADSAIVLVDASAGVQVGTENAWHFADERALPRMIFISRIDRENADFDRVVDALVAEFGRR